SVRKYVLAKNSLRLSLLALGVVLCAHAPRAEDAPPFQPSAILHIHSAQDAVALRAAIVRDIWKTDTLPEHVPVEVGDRAPPLGAENIADSQVVTRTMDFGVKSQA